MTDEVDAESPSISDRPGRKVSMERINLHEKEQFMKDLAFAKKIQGKIILVADDAGPGMRASGVPIVRMQAMSSDAMRRDAS